MNAPAQKPQASVLRANTWLHWPRVPEGRVGEVLERISHRIFRARQEGAMGCRPRRGKWVFGCGRTVRLTRGGALLFAGGFAVPGGGGGGGVSSGMQCRLGAGE